MPTRYSFNSNRSHSTQFSVQILVAIGKPSQTGRKSAVLWHSYDLLGDVGEYGRVLFHVPSPIYLITSFFLYSWKRPSVYLLLYFMNFIGWARLKPLKLILFLSSDGYCLHGFWHPDSHYKTKRLFSLSFRAFNNYQYLFCDLLWLSSYLFNPRGRSCVIWF